MAEKNDTKEKELELLNIKLDIEKINLEKAKKKEKRSLSKLITIVTPLIAIIGLFISVWKTNANLNQQRLDNIKSNFNKKASSVIKYSHSGSTMSELLDALNIPDDTPNEDLQKFGKTISHIILYDFKLQNEDKLNFAHTLVNFCNPYKEFLENNHDLSLKIIEKLIEQYDSFIKNGERKNKKFFRKNRSSELFKKIDELLAWHWILYESSINNKKEDVQIWQIERASLKEFSRITKLKKRFNEIRNKSYFLNSTLGIVRNNVEYGNLNKCKNFKTGKFIRLYDNLEGLSIVERNDSVQIEQSINSEKYIKYEIRWVTDCSYQTRIDSTNINDSLIPSSPPFFKIENISRDNYSFRISTNKSDYGIMTKYYDGFQKDLKFTTNELFPKKIVKE